MTGLICMRDVNEGGLNLDNTDNRLESHNSVNRTITKKNALNILNKALNGRKIVPKSLFKLKYKNSKIPKL